MSLPESLPAPALRAFAAAGYTTLAELAAVPERELLALHGVGPKVIRLLREAYAESGLVQQSG